MEKYREQSKDYSVGTKNSNDLCNSSYFIKLPHPKIYEEYEEICTEVGKTIQYFIKGEVACSLSQQMDSILFWIEKNMNSLTQNSITYRIMLHNLFRVHLQLQFVSEFEDQIDTKQENQTKQKVMELFCEKLKLIENKYPVLDLYYFSFLTAQYYQFKAPAQKTNPDFIDKAIPIIFQMISICQNVVEIGVDVFQSKFSSLISGIMNLQKYAWDLYIGKNYASLLKDIFHLWLQLTKEFQEQKKIELESEVLFYIREFLNTPKNKYTLKAFILMQIDFQLQKIIEVQFTKKEQKVLNLSQLSIVNQFIQVITIDNQTPGLFDSILEFFNIKTCSVFARYSQLSIQLSLYKLIQQENTNSINSILSEMLEIDIIRSIMIEKQQNIKILILSDRLYFQIDDKFKSKNIKIWKKFIEKNKFKEHVATLIQSLEKPLELIQLEEQIIDSPQELDSEVIINNEGQAIQIYQQGRKQEEQVFHGFTPINLEYNQFINCGNKDPCMIDTQQDGISIRGLCKSICYWNKKLNNSLNYCIRICVLEKGLYNDTIFEIGLIKQSQKKNPIPCLSFNVIGSDKLKIIKGKKRKDNCYEEYELQICIQNQEFMVQSVDNKFATELKNKENIDPSEQYLLAIFIDLNCKVLFNSIHTNKIL